MQELESTEWFGEYIRGVEIAGNVRNRNKTTIDMIANPVIGSVNMFHRTLMLWVFRDL